MPKTPSKSNWYKKQPLPLDQEIARGAVRVNNEIRENLTWRMAPRETSFRLPERHGVQNLPDPPAEDPGAVRLLQDDHALLDQVGQRRDFVAIAGGKDRRHAWIEGPDRGEHFGTAAPGHDDVQQHQRDAIAISGENFQGLVAIAGQQRFVALRP